jgi:NADH-quinone oxidoreductase subunit G
MSPFRHALEYAQVLLPVSPFTETGGSFVNTEGRVQSFQGVVKPLGETRPAWKVLRVLGNLLELPGFAYDSVDGVRADCVAAIGEMASRLDNGIEGEPRSLSASAARAGQSGPERSGIERAVIERIGDVPIYHVDGIVRRAESLQLTRYAQAAVVSLPGGLVEKLGLRPNDRVRVFQHGGEAVLPFLRDDGLPADCARIPAGCPETSGLGALFGEIELERAAAQERASA